MKINHALAMVLSALSAGILISCVKPADESKAPEVDSQVAQESATSTATTEKDNSADKITAVDISADTEKISANYENGILAVDIPKREEAKPKPSKIIEIK